MIGRRETDRLALAVEANPQSGDVNALEQGLLAFEERRLGSPEHAHFAVFLRDGYGNVQGGLDAHIMWRRLFVKTLWIAEDYRHMGHGSRLMAATEAEARARRCRSVWLTALGDRACRFYLKLDYSIFGMLEDYVGGQSLYSLQKDL